MGLKFKNNPNDVSWIAGSNNVDWFVENVENSIRLDLNTLDYPKITDSKKWRLVRNIADMLNKASDEKSDGRKYDL